MFFYLAITIILVVFLLAKLKYDSRRVWYRGAFYHKHSRLSQFLVHKWVALEEPFRPTFWATHPHMQTLLFFLWPRTVVKSRREYLQLEDHGVVALDWITSNERSLNSSSAVLIVIPGLTCSIDEVAMLCAHAHHYPFRYVVFNRRGHGGSALTTACLQNAFDYKDVDEAISYIHSIYPCAKLVSIAYSSGAALLLSYLEETKKVPLSAAVCISPNYGMEKGQENRLPSIYEYLMTKRLVHLLKQHPGLSSIIDYELALRSRSIKEFNERVYDPLNGYPTLNNNPINNIARIKVPTLCISALDDPICTKDNIPYSLFKTSSNLYLITCEKGGHCGFLQGDIHLHSWADHLACTFLDAMIHFNVRKTVENQSLFNFPCVARDRSYTQ